MKANFLKSVVYIKNLKANFSVFPEEKQVLDEKFFKTLATTFHFTNVRFTVKFKDLKKKSLLDYLGCGWVKFQSLLSQKKKWFLNVYIKKE